MKKAFGLIVMASLILANCEKETTPTGPTTPRNTWIALSQLDISLTSLGATLQLTATITDQSGTPLAYRSHPSISSNPVTWQWATSDASIATVSSAGLVTAVGIGSTTITVSSGAVYASTNITVTAETVSQVASSITLAPTSKTFASVGDTATTTATVKDANGNVMTGQTVTWATSSASIATVNDPNVVLGHADVRFLAPVRVGERVVATASVTAEKGRKRTLQVSASVGEREVLAGTLTAFVLDRHVLDG